MRILIINRFFWPDESSTAMLASDLAEDFAAAGHEVDVACARILYDKPEISLQAREDWRGIRIHRLPSARFGRGTLSGRFLDLITFHASLFLIAPFRFKPDIILVMTDPAMVLLDAMWIARLRGSRIVHHVMDLYPDIAVALGAVRNRGVLDRLLQSMMQGLLRRCDQVIALGDSMRERLIQKGVDADRISVVPPWASALPRCDRETNSFRKKLGLASDDFLVMYSGNMGKAHPFDAVIRAMIELKDNARIHFAFVGGGARLDEIRGAISEHRLVRASLLPYQPRERLFETLSAADLHLITQDPATTGLIVPSKLAGILAAGRPALFIGDPSADVARDLLVHGCGRVVSPKDTHEIVSVIREIAGDSVLREEMNQRAQATYLRSFAREICSKNILQILDRAVGSK